MVNVSRTRTLQNSSRSEEEKSFEQGVIYDMQQPASEPQYGEGGKSTRESNESHTEAEGYDTDVLYTVVGQETFQIVLGQSKEDA